MEWGTVHSVFYGMFTRCHALGMDTTDTVPALPELRKLWDTDEL